MNQTRKVASGKPDVSVIDIYDGLMTMGFLAFALAKQFLLLMNTNRKGGNSSEAV